MSIPVVEAIFKAGSGGGGGVNREGGEEEGVEFHRPCRLHGRELYIAGLAFLVGARVRRGGVGVED